MPEDYTSQQSLADINTRLRDLEEKNRLLKERLLLIGKSIVSDRDEKLKIERETKAELLKLKEENLRMKDLLHNVSEQMSDSARKEELMIIQRQLDMLKPNIKR